MDVLVAEFLEERARPALPDALDDRLQVPAARDGGGHDVVEQRHAQGRAERQQRPRVVGVRVVEHLEALVAQPLSEVRVVDVEAGLERALGAVAVEDEVVDVARGPGGRSRATARVGLAALWGVASTSAMPAAAGTATRSRITAERTLSAEVSAPSWPRTRSATMTARAIAATQRPTRTSRPRPSASESVSRSRPNERTGTSTAETMMAARRASRSSTERPAMPIVVPASTTTSGRMTSPTSTSAMFSE